MTYRIPPSLAWLVNKRARVNGELQRVGKVYSALLEELEQTRILLKAKADALTRDLAAIDHTLGLHEIRIDPNRIVPIQTQSNSDILKRGAITKAIFEYLYNLEAAHASTREIAIFVAHENSIDPDCSVFVELRRRVRHRLKTLSIKGSVKRWHRRVGNDEGKWSLSIRDQE
jgi:hypothetical protein